MKNILTAMLCLSFLSSASLFSGCSGSKIDEGNPQDLYKDAEEDISDKRYLIAMDKLKSVKNKFPYSNVATQAQLRIADIYFLQETYAESAAAYEAFRDLHPKHERSDYVLYRIAESYYNQLPSGEDRDLSPATKAIDMYRELLSLYPKSQYAGDAEAHLISSLNMLSSKERYVADFYYKRSQYESAATRYENIVKKYSGTSQEEFAYFMLARSQIKLEKRDEAKHTLHTYVSRFPGGKYTSKATALLADISTTSGDSDGE